MLCYLGLNHIILITILDVYKAKNISASGLI